jgi:peptidoglycan/xylan/chitin deacetylase (PgdA/CDA1 family)
MQVVLSFDYELFFGSNTGTVEKCMIEPTNHLLNLVSTYQIPMTFFVDAGYIWRLQQDAGNHASLQSDYERICDQIQRMESLGCEIQFHVHPHWENARFLNGKWEIDTANCYKLSDFAPSNAIEIIHKYFSALQGIVNRPMLAFRAGGWCIQPFESYVDVFKALGIQIDSSVFPGGYFTGGSYDFDFRAVAPFSNPYRFETDVCIPDENGYFLEAPIASWKYSPLFYWELYLFGRLFPAHHKMMGDGSFLAQPGRKKSVLTSFTWNHVSTDGYYAKLLQRQFNWYKKNNKEVFVVIGHPKGLTNYALRKTEEFIANNRNASEFVTYSQLKCTF